MNLLENFINSLYERITKRSELVLYISDVLSIERESANRRLNGKVQFTIQEMGKLSQKLGISLDDLMQNKNLNALPNLKMKLPMSGHSDDLISSMEFAITKLEEICQESVEYGTAFSSIPVEFYLPYPNLEKFMFYKWGYFHIGSNEYDKYALWEISERQKKINRQLTVINTRIKSHIYIWNPVTIWSMVKEVKYFKSIHAITDEDVAYIKADLHKMLGDIEIQAKMSNIESDNKIEMYVSFINHGLNFCYFKTENKYYVTFEDYFVGLDYYDNRVSFASTHEWFASMKKISTLISESGAVERRLFFEEQHNCIRDI